MPFKDDFVWGAAASSYQIEGAAYEADKGLSVWDVYSHTPGMTHRGQTGDVACDHYHRYEDDIALMKKIGLHAYRLSINWPRVIPAGTGPTSSVGLDFYNRLIDALLEAGITPYVTLFHWDYPYDLYSRGGWLNRYSAEWFADYTTVVVNALGDRVKHWFTLNEPGVFVNIGHRDGRHAPGEHYGKRQIIQVAHNVLRAHGLCVQAIRAASGDARIGTAPNSSPPIPLTNSAADIDAALQVMFGADSEFATYEVPIWLEPALRGEYPADGLKYWEPYLPSTWQDDLKDIHQPVDFLGANIYQGYYVQAGEDGTPERVPFKTGYPRTRMQGGWPVTPEALYWGPKMLYERYGLPIYITENGLSSMDWVALDGRVHDANRIDFLQRYLREYQRAADDGVDLLGYFQWSIMDNFEWGEAYSERFGLIHVDYETQERTLKDSAYWYHSVIQSNGAALSEPPVVDYDI